MFSLHIPDFRHKSLWFSCLGDRGAMDKTPTYQFGGFTAVGSSPGLGGLVSWGKKRYPNFLLLRIRVETEV